MTAAIVAALVAFAPLLLAILQAYAKQRVADAPEKRDEQIDQAFAGSHEAVGAQLHDLRDRLRRHDDPQ